MRGMAAGILALVLLTAAGGHTALAEAQTVGPRISWSRTPLVGLQIGHWQAAALPAELADLRSNAGAERDGFRELDANMAVTKAAAAALRAEGVRVDVLPATVPVAYAADAFVAVHSDQDKGDQHWRGYKAAASALSGDKSGSRLLASELGATYAAETGLPADIRAGAITPDMRFYYSFNWRSFQHAINAQTPAAIIELGFVSDEADREVLFDRPDAAGQALADGILSYLLESAGLV